MINKANANQTQKASKICGYHWDSWIQEIRSNKMKSIIKKREQRSSKKKKKEKKRKKPAVVVLDVTLGT